MTAADARAIAEALAELVGAGPLPDPGSGGTDERFAALSAVARRSLPLGRLYEGHADAVAILHEDGREAPPGALAVWASEGGAPVEVRTGPAGPVASGTKPFCSGATHVGHALVTARHEGRPVLALVELAPGRFSTAGPPWVGEGMREADTAAVVLDDAPVCALVGPPGWYPDRPGFWHGAVGVAACWFGGALGVLDALRASVGRDDPHGLGLLGEADATGWAMESVLLRAAAAIDADPTDAAGEAHRRALRVRAEVERGCRAVLDHTAVALGPRPLALDADHARRVADLQVYLRQHHGRRDHAALGALVRADADADADGRLDADGRGPDGGAS